MIDLFNTQSSDNIPEFIEITYEQVEKYWKEWLIWRNTGRRNANGGFEPSISYLEAVQSIPSEELSVFLELDNLYEKMEAQYIKQTSGKA